MKANEIQIGDWVYSTFSKLPCKVTYLKLHESGYASVETTNVVGVKDIASLSPIPLTPEILEKNGWIKDGYFYRAKDGSYIQLGQLFEHATFSCKKDGINREVVTSPSILKYVHQLQHALRLCGTEKEIVL